jgi:hypothetical protein
VADVVVLGAGQIKIPTGEKKDDKIVVNVHELPRIAVMSSGLVAFEDEAGIHVNRLGLNWDVVITDVEYSITRPGVVGAPELAYECEYCNDGERLPLMRAQACPKCLRGVGGRHRG